MWKSSLLFFIGAIVLVLLFQSANSQTHKPANRYGHSNSGKYKSQTATDNIENVGSGEYSSLAGQLDVRNNIPRNYESQNNGGLSGKNNVSDGHKIKYIRDSPSTVYSGRVVLRSPPMDPERFVINANEMESTGFNGYLDPPSFSGPEGLFSEVIAGLFAPINGPSGPLPQSGYPGSFVGTSGLLTLLFGDAVNPFDRYSSFCNRITVLGRFLRRLLEPLFTTGFFMAASYFLQRSILPRIAHYIHVYTSMKGQDDARFISGPFRNLNVLSAVVNEAISSEPRFLYGK